MIGYPYTYGDELSEQEAMRRRVTLFDNGLIIMVLWGLKATISHAQDLPITSTNSNTGVEGSNTPVFAPIAAACSCTSPQVKTAILLSGIGAICYCALCTKDKPLVAACSALATYAATKLN